MQQPVQLSVQPTVKALVEQVLADVRGAPLRLEVKNKSSSSQELFSAEAAGASSSYRKRSTLYRAVSPSSVGCAVALRKCCQC